MVAVNDLARNTGLNHGGQSSSDFELARAMLRIVPRMNRWAESRALDTEAGGDLSLRQLSALAVIITKRRRSEMWPAG